MKENLKKLSNCLWEVPKSGKMKVPAWLFLSERLLKDVEDGAIQQAANVATMPGIYKHALAMPDMHFGYGFPIGGVAALDCKEGGLSPGGIGFDINCLSGDTKILSQHGYYKTIAEMEKTWNKETLKCMELSKNYEQKTEVERFIKIKPHTNVFKITTSSGYEIIATADHPIWTPSGMTLVKELRTGDKIAIYPFKGIEYEEPKNEVVIDEKKIIELDIPWNKKHIISELKKRDLLPLYLNSHQMPYLLKILGYVIGDGSLIIAGEKNKGFVWFWGKKEDLELIREDIKRLNYTPSKIYKRERSHSIDTKYGNVKFTATEYSMRVSSRSFLVLLNLLGSPIGNKTKQDYCIPEWLMKAPLWYKRLFLASFFGAEMSSPKTMTSHGYNFYMPTISMNKNYKLIESGKKFFNQIASMLMEFGINSMITEEKFEYINKDGEVSYKIRLLINGDNRNLITLYEKIGFEYNKEKSYLANASVVYLKLKNDVIQQRNKTQKIAISFYTNGTTPKEIYQSLGSDFINKRFIERSLFEGRKTSSRISSNFLTFDKFLENSTEGLGKSGMIWDSIKSKNKIKYDDYVYDFTVKHDDHNFIANSFVVSNCGVRVLRTNLTANDVRPKISRLLESIFRNVPSGVGRGGKLKLSRGQIDEVLELGVEWALENNYANKNDLKHIEENGSMKQADASKVSDKAKKRGAPQLGTLGAGNHFLEIQRVDKIYLPDVAKEFGIDNEDQICVMIHTGSRGLGHQVCTDYLQILEKAFHDEIQKLPDRELVYAPAGTQECEDYFRAMCSAANYAWTNRQLITHWTRESIVKTLGMKEEDIGLELVYDVAHNMGKIENYKINGKMKKVYVHRKGATRAFPPGSPDIPSDYQRVGQPVLIPGSMGTASYILVGAETAEETFFSTAHGAGRVYSRSKMLKTTRGENVSRELAKKGIVAKSASWKVLAEEAPSAYKNIDEVARVTQEAGISKIVARLVPLGVVKG